MTGGLYLYCDIMTKRDSIATQRPVRNDYDIVSRSPTSQRLDVADGQ